MSRTVIFMISIDKSELDVVPADFEPAVTVEIASDKKASKLPADDTFKKSIKRFYDCISDAKIREKVYDEIILQANLLNAVR